MQPQGAPPADLLTQVGVVVSGALALIYTIHQVVQRLFPPRRRSADTVTTALRQIAEDLRLVVNDMHESAVALQHQATVQDEIAASLREERTAHTYLLDVTASIRGQQTQLLGVLQTHSQEDESDRKAILQTLTRLEERSR